MYSTFTILAALAVQAGEPLQALTPPRIVSAPVARVEESAETTLSVGRFRFVMVQGYAGPITWDWTNGEAVSAFALKSGSEFPGFIEGGKRAEIHKVPESQSEVLAVFGEAAGSVQVTAWGIRDGKPVKLGTQVISVGGARPPPVPVPPGPTPKGEAAWVIVVEETAQRTAATAKLLTDLKYWNGLTAKGHQWRHYDKDARDIPAGYYQGDPLPIMLIVSKDGKQLYRGPLPATAAEITATVELVTGAK